MENNYSIFDYDDIDINTDTEAIEFIANSIILGKKINMEKYRIETGRKWDFRDLNRRRFESGKKVKCLSDFFYDSLSYHISKNSDITIEEEISDSFEQEIILLLRKGDFCPIKFIINISESGANFTYKISSHF